MILWALRIGYGSVDLASMHTLFIRALLYYVHIAVVTLDVGLLARSQYSEGPATGHLDTGLSWFPCVYKRMLRWFPRFQVTTTCFSCSPPDLKVKLVISFIYLYTRKITTATGWQPNCSSWITHQKTKVNVWIRHLVRVWLTIEI
jgi:hypothetical protein